MPECVDGMHRFDESEFVIKSGLNFEPFDAVAILFEFPGFDRFELVAGHRRPAREIGGQQVLGMRDQLVAIPEADGVTHP